MAVQAQLYSENLGLPMPDWNLVNPVPPPSVPTTFDGGPSCFNLHDQHHPPLFSNVQQTQTHQNQNLDAMAFSQSLNPLLQSQSQEIDSLLHSQSESLRSALQYQRKQQLKVLVKGMESRAMKLMRQKEQVLAQATKKSMELESCLRKVKLESESWQRVARENEAMVADLSSMLEQVREKMVIVGNGADDAASFCCGSSEDRSSSGGMISSSSSKKMVACRGCNSRRSCVLFLPCRHLCSCKHCEAFLVSCPVCKAAKQASFEVFWV